MWKIIWLERLDADILRLRLERNAARPDSNILRLSFCGFGFYCTHVIFVDTAEKTRNLS